MSQVTQFVLRRRRLVGVIWLLAIVFGGYASSVLQSHLSQSFEIPGTGSDIADALRVFSDEMRDKRLLRAEEQANKLAVKMTIPLALFIFPVVLMVIMLPIAVRLLTLIHSG